MPYGYIFSRLNKLHNLVREARERNDSKFFTIIWLEREIVRYQNMQPNYWH